jgi:type II secretory pathway pseudopilin PulG
MAVVVIVAVLAGLVLSTIGYVNRKGAASRAKTEVAALSSAIESYKLDFGSCPARPALLGQQFPTAVEVNIGLADVVSIGNEDLLNNKNYKLRKAGFFSFRLGFPRPTQ